jgi:hypothetical protein
MVHKACSTASGEGRKIGAIHPSAGAAAHSPIAAAAVTSPATLRVVAESRPRKTKYFASGGAPALVL